jgi:hypothetical protein
VLAAVGKCLCLTVLAGVAQCSCFVALGRVVVLASVAECLHRGTRQ